MSVAVKPGSSALNLMPGSDFEYVDGVRGRRLRTMSSVRTGMTWITQSVCAPRPTAVSSVRSPVIETPRSSDLNAVECVFAAYDLGCSAVAGQDNSEGLPNR